MDRAYIDDKTGQAICCWNAPDEKTIQDIFKKAQVKPESIKSVTVYNG
ncbi:MAG: nickel-binding protein [candidate division WOR-3 bacterium]